MHKDFHKLLLGLALAMPVLSISGESTVQVAKVSGFADDAAFLLYLNGNVILTNFTRWKESGAFESKGEGMAEGDLIRMATTMSCDPEGRWSEVSMVMPIHKTGVKRSGNNAILILPDGKSRTVPLKPGVFPFVGMLGLNLYTRFYDEAKAGKQVLPILIPHKKADQISMERKQCFSRMLGGKMFELREFELKAGDLNAVIWVDDGGRMIKSAQPEESTVFIRYGYEAWREER